MKTILSLILIVMSLAVGYLAWTKYQTAETNGAAARPLATRPVERIDIDFAVTAAGEIGPAEQVSVRPEINGKVATLPVDIGDTVKKGDVLFTLDDQELRNQRDSTETEVQRAQLELKQAERNFNRNQELFEQELISEEEIETFKTQWELAKNTLKRAEKNLAVVEERLTKSIIVAPFDCTVLDRPVSIGQAVSGSAGVGGGTEVLAIADLNKLIIQAHINQADVTRLQTKQSVNIEVEAVPGLHVVGRVERIAPQATIRNNIKGYLSRIILENVDPRVRPGMTANIKIPVDAVNDVLAVPLSAVFTEFDKETKRSERYVYIQKGDSYERRPVQIGLSDYFHVEVQSGVTEGDVVSLEQPPPEQVIRIMNQTERGKGNLDTAGERKKGSSNS